MAGIDITSDGLANEIKSRFDKASMDKTYLVQDVKLDNQFIIGNQYTHIHTIDKYNLDIVTDENADSKIVFNRMGQIYQKRTSILLRNIPDAKVIPTRKRIEYDKKAKITNALIDKIKEDNDFKVLYKKFVKKLESQGFAFYKIIYDNKIGELLKLEIKRMQSEEKVFGENDMKKMAYVISKMYEGAVSLYVGGVHEFYVSNSRSDNLEENQYIIHAKAFHVEDIKKVFGVTVKSEEVSRDTKQNTIDSFGAAMYDNTRGSNKKLDDYAMVYEYYEKPTYNRPNGKKIVSAGGEIISISDLPYQCGKNGEFAYNFEVCVQVPIDSYFYGHSIYRDLRPIQRSYNDIRNTIRKYAKRASIGQYTVPIGALEDSSQITNEISGVIEYNAMFGKIENLPVGDFPVTIWNDLNQCNQEFSSISGLSVMELLGNAPSNIRSGDQMEQVKQGDESSAGLSVDNIIEATINTFTKALRIYKQKTKKFPIELYDNDGLDKLIVTSDNILENVKVINAGILGLTKQQEENKVMRAVSLGVLNKEENNPYGNRNTQVLLDTMGLSHLEIDSDFKYQEDFANVENVKMVQTMEEIAINDWDDDQIHVQCHQRMFMSSEYIKAIKLDPNGAEKHERNLKHVQSHKKKMSDQQMKQMMMQQLQTAK